MRLVLRVRRTRSRLRRFLGLSIGAHVGAVALLVFIPFLRPKADLLPIDAAFVELSGAITVAASGPAPAAPSEPAPPAVVPPEPEPIPEPEAAHAVEKIPEPSKKKEEKKMKEEKKVETTKREERRPAPPSTSPRPPGPGTTGTGTAGTPDAPGATAGAAGITSLEGSDPGLAWYNAAVAGALENAWMRPVLEGVAGVQSVIVAFEIGRDGAVFNLAIDVPSGIASLDRSALRAVTDASPFPPPPPSSRGSSVRQRIRFDLRPEAR